jgi:hypothetical protein
MEDQGIYEPADPVLSPEELLRMHPLSALFVRVDTEMAPSLEEVEQKLSTICLRTSVPESVRRTFRLSRRLYLFAYFEYEFFTVSQHYALLALEAAVYSRWISDLPSEITVQAGSDEPCRMRAPTHKKLYDLWIQSKKKHKVLKVEGKDFPNSVFKVLERLVARRLITTEQQDRMKAAFHLRNDMSHLESRLIAAPSIGFLATTAEFINTIYSREQGGQL